MKRQVFTLSLLGLAMFANAQTSLRETIRGEKGITKHDIRLPESLQTNFSPSAARSLFGLDAQSDLIVKKQESDKLGFIHYRYYQTYKGIPVENAAYIVHTKNGKVTGMSGSIITDFDAEGDHPSRASVNAQAAIAAALKQVNAQRYAWQDASFEAAYKQQMGAAATYAPKATLAWFSDDKDVNPRAIRLAYKIDIYAIAPLSRAYYFIDAVTGEYLGKKDIIEYTDATGTAATAYSGTQTIHSDLSGGSYRLRDLTKGGGIITLHGESGSKGTDYTSTTPNWSFTTKSQAALDAHYGVSQTYAYYYTTFGRNSYDNAGTALTSYVNIPNTSDNAYWDGSAMNFGTRSTGNTGGVTGIDVTGHELTHGVTQSESGLNYSKEPGAMNESMSDIFGKTVQFWSKPSDVNWKLSNDMNWFIRDMSNPNAYSQPDTYKGTKWTTSSADNYGVHTNSGVGNFMYYLLVTGGSGTNDIGNAYSVTGIGLTEAAAILYRTNTTYLTATSQYADWRTACINAATDLYGGTSNEVVQVENAWYAVGVGTAGTGGGGTCSAPAGLVAGSLTSSSASLSWTAASGAVSYKLQYKLSTSSTWTTVTGITGTSYTLSGLSASTSYNAQVATVCSGGTSAYSSAITFTTSDSGTITYCASSGGSSEEYINSVVLGSINNVSGNNGGYADFTSKSTSLVAGSSYTATLTPGFASTSYNEAWTLWIDYNGDGDFADAGEKVGTATAAKTAKTITFKVPATAKNGSTRIRIQMKYSSASTTSCGTYTYGEVEDYTGVISGGSGFASSSLVVNAGIANATLGINGISVYPNPVAHSNATVSYNLAKEGNVTLKVIDVIGRTAQAASFGKQSSGAHTYSLATGGKLGSGNYLIVLQQDGQIIGRTKLVVTQ